MQLVATSALSFVEATHEHLDQSAVQRPGYGEDHSGGVEYAHAVCVLCAQGAAPAATLKRSALDQPPALRAIRVELRATSGHTAADARFGIRPRAPPAQSLSLA